MSHKNLEVEVEHESHARRTPEQRNVTLVTQPHITYTRGAEWVTLPSERRGSGRSLPQKVVEPAPRGVHPFYPDVDAAPPFLDLRPQELGHVLEQVQRPAVSEVQPGRHAGSMA